MTERADDHDDDAPDVELDAALRDVIADPATWASPGDDLEDRIASAVASEAALGAPTAGTSSTPRPWLRPGLLGAAAAVLFVFGGVVVLSALDGSVAEPAVAVELVPTGIVPDVGGDVSIASTGSGLRIDLQADGLPRRDGGRYYEGWLRTVDGALVPVGTFHDGDAVTLWAGIELERVDRFTITLETAVAGDDPQQMSSGEVVLRADIAP